MGHIVNPISTRLALNSFWNSNWSINNRFNFVNLYQKDYLLFYYLDWFFRKTKFLKIDLLLSHYKVYRVNNKIYINLYYYKVFLPLLLLKENLLKRNILLNLLLKLNNDNFIKNASIVNFSNKNSKKQLLLNKDVVYLNSIKLDKKNEEFYDKIEKFYLKIFLSSLYWYLLSNSLSFFLKKLNFSNDLFYFNIYNLDFLDLSVQNISNYIAIQIRKKFSLNWVLKPILKDLSIKINNGKILGYKIICSGRFTRKQRATYRWMSEGLLKLNTVSNLIKYNFVKVRLKYGVCGVKVWLNYGLNNENILPRNLFLVYPLLNPLKFEWNLNYLEFLLNYWFFDYLRINSLKKKSYKFYSDYIKLKLKFMLSWIFYKQNVINKYSLNKSYNNLTLSILYKKNNKISLPIKYNKV